LKRILAIIFLISLNFAAFGQREVSYVYKHYQEVDMKKFHYGFTLGLNYMDCEIRLRQMATGKDVLFSEVATAKPGFNVGVIGEMRMGEHFALRLTPGFIFGSRTITYVNSLEETVQETSSSSIVFESPILIKYFAKRRGNTRGYAVVGAGLKYDIIYKNKLDPKDGVFTRNKPLDFSIELGLGFDWYMEFFKLSTELRVSIGLVDVLNHSVSQKAIDDAKVDGFDNIDMYTKNVDRMTSKVVSILFHFE